MYVVSEALSEPADVVVPEGLRYGTPCAFKGCAGFFHPADGSTGVVLCSPWGFEDLVMRKSWRLLAEAIAAAGYPCLRFDYPGTGDSLGHTTSIESVVPWIEAIHDAAEVLRLNSGVRRFVFIGQSLGAMLAVEAARTRSDVVALQLVAPVVKARHYMRELAATATMVAERIGIELELSPGEGLSVVGFGLSRGMVEDLKRLDLTKISDLNVRNVTIFDSADRKAGAEVSEHLRRIGLAVALERVEPYHLMVSDATEIQPLPVSYERVVAALRRAAPAAPGAATTAPRFPNALVTDIFREEPVRFGPADALFGVLTCSRVERADAPAIVMLNRGLNPHVGWRRVSVDHARALAAAGITSLRFDVAGLGESRDEAGRPANLIYSDLLLPDVRAAVDLLVQRGHTRIALAGVCSGAFIALSAAQADPRVSEVVVFNPQRFVWNPAESMQDVIRYGLRSMNDYVGDFKRGGVLRKLVRSRRRIVPAMTFLLKRIISNAMARLPLKMRSMILRSSMAARVTQFFQAFADRGTRVTMIFTKGDPSLNELGAYFGPDGRNLGFANVSVEILSGLDHNLTSNAAADVMLDRILVALEHATPRETCRPVERIMPEPRRQVCAT